MLEGQGSTDSLGDRLRIRVPGYTNRKAITSKPGKLCKAAPPQKVLPVSGMLHRGTKMEAAELSRSPAVTKERARLPSVAISEVRQLLGSSA